MTNARPNNTIAMDKGLLDDSKGKRKIPDWKRKELELKAMEKKIGFETDRIEEPSVVWKVNEQSYTDLDQEFLAKRRAASVKGEEAEQEKEVKKAQKELEEAEKKVREGEYYLSDAYRKAGIIPF